MNTDSEHKYGLASCFEVGNLVLLKHNMLPSLFGWAHDKDDPCFYAWQDVIKHNQIM